LKALPDGRDKAAEERAFLDECHRTKNRRSDTEAILLDESFFNAAARPAVDVWSEFHATTWKGKAGYIKGSEIQSALRDHLAKLQKGRCCYCGQSLLKGGYARPIEHVLSRKDHPRYSLHFWNVAVACERCNRIKLDKYGSSFKKNRKHYPEPAEFTHQYHPRFHPHKMHLRSAGVSTDEFRYTFYIGLSDQGRSLVDSVLAEAALEEALESNDPALAGSVEKIRAFIQGQSRSAVGKVEAFQQALAKLLVSQAADC
jgi:5-methylcytosine-specific restriction endonuclease McrA